MLSQRRDSGSERDPESGAEQLSLDVEWTAPAARADAWWVAAIEHETEGNQDTGWWDA